MSDQSAESSDMAIVADQSIADSSSLGQGGETEDTDDRIVWRRLLQRKLLLRVTIPTAIGLIQLVFAILAIVSGDARPAVLLFLLPALLVGYWFGKQTRIAWDDESAQVSLIQAQVMLAVSYIAVRIATHFLLEWSLNSRINGVATVLLIVSFGLFFGRSVGLTVQIWHALTSREEEQTSNAEA